MAVLATSLTVVCDLSQLEDHNAFQSVFKGKQNLCLEGGSFLGGKKLLLGRDVKMKLKG